MSWTLLDAYCCEGIGSRGYDAAGFKVTGVDLDGSRRRHYPYEFHQGDAVEFIREHGHKFDAIAASPPCQFYSITKHSHSKEHPDLLAPTRDALRATGRPYVIENVPGAPLIDPLTLCGSMFDLTAVDEDGTPLRLQRHRLFESNIYLPAPGRPCHHDRNVQVGGVYGGGSADRAHAKNVRRGGYTPAKRVRAQLLGVNPDEHTMHGLSQAIPPAYTEHIGRILINHLEQTQEKSA